LAVNLLQNKFANKSTNKSMAITGLVLSGGRGSRMGSIDKGLQLFQAKPMVQHVIDRLAPQVQSMIISANQHREDYEAFGFPVLTDMLPNFSGPLAGLQMGLMHCQTDYLVCVPCDSPFFPLDYVERMADAFSTHQPDIALAVTTEGTSLQTHPVFCLLQTSLLPHLNTYLHSGGRKMYAWMKTLNTTEVHFRDNATFRNINTLDELRCHEHTHNAD
jgi:molybdopterin-guanine dinucleotide biosynthesis protein A